jgi:hypothetical protein
VNQDERLFMCGKCSYIGRVSAFIWSREQGVTCRTCLQNVYVLAMHGPSPYRAWPIPHQGQPKGVELLRLMRMPFDDEPYLTTDDLTLYRFLREKLEPRKVGGR